MSRRRSWAAGWGIGLLSGAILGGVLGSASGSDAVFTRQESTVLGAIAVGALGSMTGALIGLLTPDQWVEAEGFGHRRRIAVAPIVGPRTGVAAQLRF